MNQEKLYQSVGYLLEKYNGRLNEVKLIKLLYLADREMIHQTGDSITGDKYFSMKQGPVLSCLHNLIRRKCREPALQSVWDSYFAEENHNLLKKPEVQTGIENLTRREISILGSVAEQFREYDRRKLIDYVHNKENFPEIKWEEADNRGNTSIPISIDSIRRALGFTDSEIAEIHTEDELLERENAVLGI